MNKWAHFTFHPEQKQETNQKTQDGAEKESEII